MTEVVHRSPGKVSPGGKHVMPCCGRQTTDMPPGVLLTMHPERVTCTGPEPAPKCPSGAEYGHGMSLTTVHAGGCCEAWAAAQTEPAPKEG